MKLLKRIEVLEDYIGRAIVVSRLAPPSWRTVIVVGTVDHFYVPLQNEGSSIQDTRKAGTLSEILITASGTVLTLLNEDGDVYWTVTPDTSVTSIE